MKTALMNAIDEISALPDEKKQPIKGKRYALVATRVEIFRKHFGEKARLETEIIDCDLDRVCMRCTVYVKQDGAWEPIGSGFAEEFRKGPINSTSALENCETSAVGRALANIGLHGGEYASAFEVDNAINNKPKVDTTDGFNIVGEKGFVVANVKTAELFWSTFRLMVKDPESAACREIYRKNKDTVSKALKAASKEGVDLKHTSGLRQMVEAYE
tara:strand:- start:14979 stop:15623 length:645 start_codon:yes stop_codon:yes gene_type:complete